MRCRPELGDRDAEGRHLGADALGDGNRNEDPFGGEAGHGDLGPGDELLDQRRAAARQGAGGVDRRREPRQPANDGAVRPAGPVRDLHDHGRRELDVADRVRDLPARLRDAGGRQRLALPELARGHERRRGGQRVREAELLGDPRGTGNRAVRARSDQAAEREGVAEALDRVLVVGRDDAAPVRQREARRRGIAVADRRGDAERPRRLQHAELLGSAPEHQQAAVFVAHRLHSVGRVGRPPKRDSSEKWVARVENVGGGADAATNRSPYRR